MRSFEVITPEANRPSSHFQPKRYNAALILRFDPAISFHGLMSVILSAFRAAESAREIYDKADQQNQAKPAAADEGAAKVKAAAAEQKKQNEYD
jgi:hypothetical protein